MSTTPTVGRIVHYTSYGTPGGEYQSKCRAALITEVVNEEDGTVSVAVINPTGLFFDQSLPHDEGQGPGSWHWACVRSE